MLNIMKNRGLKMSVVFKSYVLISKQWRQQDKETHTTIDIVQGNEKRNCSYCQYCTLFKVASSFMTLKIHNSACMHV